MLTKHLGANKIRDRVIRSVFIHLIDKFGLEIINETLAQICFEEANISKDYFYDDLSEKYEDINKLIKFRHLKSK